MTKSDYDAPLESFDVEITDLDQPTGQGRPPRLRLTPRRRRVSLVLTAVLFLLVLGVLLGSVVDVRGLVASVLLRPAPSPTVSTDLPLYVRGNPFWGQFTLDGKILTHPPLVGSGHPLLLTPGQQRHTLRWQAAPFRAQSCTFTVVDSSHLGGPCFLQNNEITVNRTTHPANVVISFFVSLNDLSADQRAAVIQQIQLAISTYAGSSMVNPGERYAVSEQEIAANPSLCSALLQFAICAARATQPLEASLDLQLDTDTSGQPCAITCSGNQQDCRTLCDDPFWNLPGQPEQGHGWDVAAIIRPLWSYATLSGQVIASNQPDSAIRGTNGYQTISLTIERDAQGWHVSPAPANPYASFYDPACEQAVQDTETLIGSNSSDPQSMDVQQVANGGAAGCLEVLKPSPYLTGNPLTPLPTTTPQPTAYCLVRFGVVLAVNDLAHRLWPYLPLANAYEQMIARQLMTALPSAP